MSDDKTTPSVIFHEPDPLRVGHLLLDRGYVLADYGGTEIDRPNLNRSIGIIRKDFIFQAEKRFWFATLVRARRQWLGSIRLFSSSEKKEETDPETWSIEVYGRNQIASLTVLAYELAEKFGVKVIVILVDENERAETFPADFVY